MEDEIIDLLLDIAHKDNKCVIIISHSKDVKKKCDVIYHLVNGRLQTKRENWKLFSLFCFFPWFF